MSNFRNLLISDSIDVSKLEIEDEEKVITDSFPISIFFEYEKYSSVCLIQNFKTKLKNGNFSLKINCLFKTEDMLKMLNLLNVNCKFSIQKNKFPSSVVREGKVESIELLEIRGESCLCTIKISCSYKS